MTQPSHRLRYSLFFSAQFLGGGVQLPFLPLWLHAKGFDAPSIGIVVALQMAVRGIGSPLGAFAADHFHARRAVAVICAFTGACLYAALHFAENHLLIAALAVLASMCVAPVAPLGEAGAVEAHAQGRLDYGQVRLWGSLSFVAGSLGGGLVLEYVPIFWAVALIALGQALLVLACFAIPGEEGPRPPAKPGETGREAFLSPAFLLFIAAASLGQSSHAMLYGFGSLNWHDQGFGEAMIGTFWMVAIAAEVGMFALSRPFAARFGGLGLMGLGLAAGVIRWPLMAIEPGLIVIFALQALHAFTFATLHLGTMVHIQRTVPQRLRNTAQGLYSAIASGIFMSLAIWGSGPLYKAAGAHGYLAMATLSITGLAIYLGLRRVSPTRRAPAGT